MATSHPRTRRVAVALLLGALVAAGCGGDEKKVVAPTTTVKRTTTTVEAEVAPLTGLPQRDAAARDRPALMVKVDNTPKGFVLQEGIDKADLVIVEETEQGTTRLAAIFQSQDAVVGPVRSARTSDVGIAGSLNRPLLAYSGANRGVLRQVREGPLVDAGIDAAGMAGIYLENQRGTIRNLYRYFLPTSEVYAAKAKDGSTPSSYFRYRGFGQASVGDPVKGVSVGYGGGSPTVVRYEWDGTGWPRTQNDRVHLMANGGPRIAPANVVILITPYRSSGFRDVTGAVSPEAVLEGGGEALFLSDGRLVKGSWARGGSRAAFTFTGPDGQPIRLTPGQTFIELAPGAGSATVLP